MKKQILLLSSFLLTGLISLTACGGGSSSSQEFKDTINWSTLKYTSQGIVDYQNVELNLWSVTTSPDAEVQDEIIADFNQLYQGKIKVKTRHISRDSFDTLLESTMNFDRENAPDILFIHGEQTSGYQSKNWLYPIGDVYEKSKVILDKDDYADALLAATTIDNRIYGIPIDCHSAMVEMRVDILEKNGLQIPTNYQELVNVCESAIDKASKGELWIRGENSAGYGTEEWRKATMSEAYTPFPLSFSDMWVFEYASYTTAIQNGASLAKPDGKPAWNSPESVKGLTLLRDWINPSETSLNKHALSKYYGSDYDVGKGPFLKGDCIFKLNGPWEYGNDLTAFDRALASDGGSDNITTRSMANMFSLDTSTEYSSKIKGEGHAVMLMSTVKDAYKACAATEFADYLTYFGGIKWAKSGHIPAAASVVEGSDYKTDPAYEKYIKYWGTPEDYITYTPTKYFGYCNKYFKEAGLKVMSASYFKESVSKILNDSYKDCVEYIELYEE